MNGNVKQEVARQILAYLREHPDAGDTIKGISEWWLMEQRIKKGIATVEKAVEILEKKGLVNKSPNGVYRINTAKIAEIQALLNEASN